MAKAIFKAHNLVRGFTKIPSGSSVNMAIHDGDTISVTADGDFSIRFLGVDTPEVSFQYPQIENDPNAGKWLSTLRFKEYLADPFKAEYIDSEDYKTKLGPGLVEHLQNKLGLQSAENHRDLAMSAQRKLEEIVKTDYDDRVSQGKEFRFFLAFAYEIMDRYGRFLCYLDRDNTPQEREELRLTYNERMLQEGYAAPYIIWPNTDPFIQQQSIIDSVPDINSFQQVIGKSKRLKNARGYVKEARDASKGIFNSSNPLLLLPFELRYLARRSSPDRYVLDLSLDRPKLKLPIMYHEIQNIEDRLFVPQEYVPLFINRGYEIES
ncbi:MAG: hypothetical protein GEU26_15875 [Nitrososphaeraceae archaeon]|nr:hypothetical protein [Nitrososphaeraceae archaeon]